jgi:hypothetical protein
MMKRALIALVIPLVVVACGNKLPGAPQGPTAQSVSVQPADLPSGMQKCSISGDVDSFLALDKTKDPATYQTTLKEWNDAKKNGATAAYVAFYTDSTAHCGSVGNTSTDFTSATYKLVVNFVIQFKDEASAAKGYTSESIFGFSASSLEGGGAPVVKGAATGLTPNSIVLSVAIANQAFYVAVWQKKAFMVILAELNIDSASSKKVALAENARIT